MDLLPLFVSLFQEGTSITADAFSECSPTQRTYYDSVATVASDDHKSVHEEEDARGAVLICICVDYEKAVRCAAEGQRQRDERRYGVTELSPLLFSRRS